MVSLSGKRQQFRCRSEVVSGVGVMSMSHVGRQYRKHGLDVDAGFIPTDQTLRRKVVPEVVKSWSSALWPPQPSATGHPGKKLLQRISREALLPGVDEEPDCFAIGKRNISCRGVVADDLQSGSVERNKPALVEFSVPDVQDSRFQIHVFSIEADHFTDA